MVVVDLALVLLVEVVAAEVDDIQVEVAYK